jgi:hypothetical protein
MTTARFTFIVGMILAAAATRLIPHLPNFTPLAAMALFGGACFADKRLAFFVPLMSLFLSDLILGFHTLLPLVYGCFALTVCLGFWLHQQRNAWQVAGAATVSAILFFILTNFGVWAFETLYPKTFAGFTECYVLAIPFFWNTLLSTLLYSALLFGGLALAENCFADLRDSHSLPNAA